MPATTKGSEVRSGFIASPARFSMAITILIVAFFLSATAYTQHQTAKLDELAALISLNAAPAIEGLTQARGEIGTIERQMRAAAAAATEGRPFDRAALDAAKRRLHADIEAYLSYPFFPGEREVYLAAAERIAQFETAIGEALAEASAMSPGDVWKAPSNLVSVTEQADQALSRLIAFNAAETDEYATRIQVTRRRATRTAYALNAVVALLATVLLAMAYRLSRRYAALVIERDRLAGEHASDLERAAGSARQEYERERQLSEKLEALTRASVAISDTAFSHPENLPHILHEIVGRAREAVEADLAALGVGADPAKPFDPWVFAGVPQGVAGEIGRLPKPVGVLGAVAIGNETLRLADVRQSAAFLGLPDRHPPIGPLLGVPIRHQHASLGTLYLSRNPGRDPFSDRDQRVVELFAAQAGVIVEEARLHHQLKLERERLRLLANMSEATRASLAYGPTLEIIAHIAVPALADVCIVHELADDGTIRAVAVAAADASREALVRETALKYPPRIEGAHPAAQALSTGRPVLIPVVSPSLLEEMAQNPEHLEALRMFGAGSMMSIPMSARGHFLGTLTFLGAKAGRFDVDALLLAEEIGRRAALSIDNARLYLEAQRAVTAREDLLAIVSHDLRNPLSSISIAAGMLDRAADLPNGAKVVSQAAGAVRRSAERMGRLISDLLLAAKAEGGGLVLEAGPERIDTILTEVSEAFLPLAEERHVSLQICSPSTNLGVLCDRQRVLQVFSNLIGNAIKFTPAGGEIAIDVKADADQVRFAVSDSGPGIPQADLAHIFDRYWQRRETARRGTGLGLFIAKALVEGHHGRIWCESQIGKGSTFYFTLPRSDAAVAQNETERSSPKC